MKAHETYLRQLKKDYEDAQRPVLAAAKADAEERLREIKSRFRFAAIRCDVSEEYGVSINVTAAERATEKHLSEFNDPEALLELRRLEAELDDLNDLVPYPGWNLKV